MMVCLHVCTGTTDKPHVPTRMKVDKNGVDIFRLPGETDLVLTEGSGWNKLALFMGVNDFKGLTNALDLKGGDYYGEGDRMVCPVCGSTVTWRV